jgi:hypothetical protein
MPDEPFADFARRLNDACDVAGVPAGRARAAAVATRWNVTKEASRKWLRGLSLPEQLRVQAMAKSYQVSYEWLATGDGSMLPGKRQSAVGDARVGYNVVDDAVTARELALLARFRALSSRRQAPLLELIASD